MMLHVSDDFKSAGFFLRTQITSERSGMISVVVVSEDQTIRIFFFANVTAMFFGFQLFFIKTSTSLQKFRFSTYLTCCFFILRMFVFVVPACRAFINQWNINFGISTYFANSLWLSKLLQHFLQFKSCTHFMCCFKLYFGNFFLQILQTTNDLTCMTPNSGCRFLWLRRFVWNAVLYLHKWQW